jgi:hypothetical protein
MSVYKFSLGSFSIGSYGSRYWSKKKEYVKALGLLDTLLLNNKKISWRDYESYDFGEYYENYLSVSLYEKSLVRVKVSLTDNGDYGNYRDSVSFSCRVDDLIKIIGDVNELTSIEYEKVFKFINYLREEKRRDG